MLLNCLSTVPKSLVSFGSWRWMSGAMKMFSRYSHFFWHSSHSSRVSLNSRSDWLILSTSPRTPVPYAQFRSLPEGAKRGGEGEGEGVAGAQQEATLVANATYQAYHAGTGRKCSGLKTWWHNKSCDVRLVTSKVCFRPWLEKHVYRKKHDSYSVPSGICQGRIPATKRDEQMVDIIARLSSSTACTSSTLPRM